MQSHLLASPHSRVRLSYFLVINMAKNRGFSYWIPVAIIAVVVGGIVSIANGNSNAFGDGIGLAFIIGVGYVLTR
jgi:hypothetical protein